MQSRMASQLYVSSTVQMRIYISSNKRIIHFTFGVKAFGFYNCQKYNFLKFTSKPSLHEKK